MIAAIAGLGSLGSTCCSGAHQSGPWAWLPGAVLLSGGSALFLWPAGPPPTPVVPRPRPSAPPARIPPGCWTISSSGSPSSRRARRAARCSAIYTPWVPSWSSAAAAFRQPPSTVTWCAIDNTYRDVAPATAAADGRRARRTEAPPPRQGRARRNRPPERLPTGRRPTSAGAAGRRPPAAPDGGRRVRGSDAISSSAKSAAVPWAWSISGVIRRSTAWWRSKRFRWRANSANRSLPRPARGSFGRRRPRDGSIIPNIVTIYDVGEERGLAYIAMEYLKGRHFSDYATSE